MKVFNRILEIIFEPFKWFSSEKVCEKLNRFFNKNTFIIYVLAFVLTYIIFFVLQVGKKAMLIEEIVKGTAINENNYKKGKALFEGNNISGFNYNSIPNTNISLFFWQYL